MRHHCRRRDIGASVSFHCTHTPLRTPRTGRVFPRASLPADFLRTAAVCRRIKLVRRDHRRRCAGQKRRRTQPPCTRTNRLRSRPRTRARAADRSREPHSRQRRPAWSGKGDPATSSARDASLPAWAPRADSVLEAVLQTRRENESRNETRQLWL